MTPSENTGREASDPVAMLRVVKIVHTIAWAFFVGCIIAMLVAAWRGHLAAAGWLSGIVLFEVIVLVVNRWRCPLTAVAGRYTQDRRDNFDIDLPEWPDATRSFLELSISWGCLRCRTLGASDSLTGWLRQEINCLALTSANRGTLAASCSDRRYVWACIRSLLLKNLRASASSAPSLG